MPALDFTATQRTIFAMRYLIAFLLAFPGAAMAADCPPSPDFSDERAALHTALINAEGEAEAMVVAGELWKLWLTAPDARAQDLLDRGMARREAYDFAGAEAILDQLIAYCPKYTEAYNQRAFARFLRDDYDGTLTDIERVLAANPYHFGALSGKAMTLMRQGRSELAQKALRRALGVHPFLRERQFLIETPDDKI